MAKHQIPEVAVADLPTDATLVDVREDDEWQAGHVAGAVHVPLSSLPGRLTDIPAGRELAVVCKVGGRSAQVVGWLREQGYDAVNVAGGMMAWQAQGRPMVSDTGQPPVVL